MSNVPEDAILSDDGYWWWDGENWQPVEGDGEGEGEGGDDGGDAEPAGEPVFEFDVGGVRVDAEDSPVPSEGEPLKIGFAVCNVGEAAGVATVTLEIDGQQTDVEWESPVVEPGFCATPDGDGYVHDVPAQSEGHHHFEAFVDPPGEYGSTTNDVRIGSPEG